MLQMRFCIYAKPHVYIYRLAPSLHILFAESPLLFVLEIPIALGSSQLPIQFLAHMTYK